MENLENTSKEQFSLFKNSREPGLYFVTTQRNLMSFLGAGMIVPAGCQFRYKADTREGYSGAIPFWKGAIPDSDDYSKLLSEERTVVIECQIEDVIKYGRDRFVVDDEHLLVMNAPLPMWHVSSIYMCSAEAIDDFVLRLPSDVVVERTLFDVFPSLRRCSYAGDLDYEGPNDLWPQLAFVDAFGGGIKALKNFASTEMSDHTHVLDLLPLCLTSNGMKFSKGSHISQIGDSDRAILLKLLPILIELKPEDGYNPLEILDSLAVALLSEEIGSTEAIKKWLSYVKRVLESEIEVPVLGDEGEIFKRSVLLFLLRPDLDRLLASVESSISPGPAVLSIAAFLAGYCCGVSRMGVEYKGDYKSYARFTKSLLDSFWCKSEFDLSAIREPSPGYGASLIYEINSESLLELAIGQDIMLARVLNQARSVGYDLVYDYDETELLYIFELEEGRSQTVHIERLEPLSDGYDVIRFVSPCHALSLAKFKSLKKANILDLLTRNGAESMYCSFAYSERRKAIVVEATQIVKTMDDDEFVTLLNHVAKVADQYERDEFGKKE